MIPFDVYLIGVGGQGIGLLSEVLLRAADWAGHPVKGVDTHGLAQRGGIVVSRVRMGGRAHSPLIPENRADMVIALERHEAARGMVRALKDGGTLVYYDAVWQPLDVRLGTADPIDGQWLRDWAADRGIRVIRVLDAHLEDARMQNIVLLAHTSALGLVPGVHADHFRQAMADLMTGAMLAANLALFERVRQTVEAGPIPDGERPGGRTTAAPQTRRNEAKMTEGDKTPHTCGICGRTRDRLQDEPVPDCCNQPMTATEPLPVCRTSGAEHSRPDDMGEPCDDGRAG